jgi:gamma-glutamylcyclotransferase (GGCT)/AIG2-like uncharacterized protein YtfP
MVTDEDLNNLLALINALRRGPSSRDLLELEAKIEARYQVSCKLAVYGSLAPGQPNHQILVDLRGEWEAGKVRGELHSHGWGMTMGFPAFRWMPEGEMIDIWLLISPELPEQWETLDRFEGPSYQRSIVPVETDTGFTVANIYELNARIRDPA